jgi:hypothetical protein
MAYQYSPASYQYSPGGGSVSSSGSTSYDYSGFDDHIKRQDALANSRDQKKAALYGGNPLQAMLAGNRVRELVGLLRRDAPGTSEQDPYQFKTPLSRISSQSSSFSKSTSPGSTTYQEGGQQYVPGERGAAPVQEEEVPPAPEEEAPPEPGNVPQPNENARFKRRLFTSMYA